MCYNIERCFERKTSPRDCYRRSDCRVTLRLVAARKARIRTSAGKVRMAKILGPAMHGHQADRAIRLRLVAAPAAWVAAGAIRFSNSASARAQA